MLDYINFAKTPCTELPTRRVIFMKSDSFDLLRSAHIEDAVDVFKRTGAEARHDNAFSVYLMFSFVMTFSH